MLQSWLVRLAEWQDRHVGLSIVVRGVAAGVTFGVFLWLAPTVNTSPVRAVIGGGAFAGVMMLFAAFQARRAGRAFPPGLDLNSRIAVRHIVRHGGTVTDVELASAVVHYARVVLAVPFQPVFACVVFGLAFLGNVGLLVSALVDGDTRVTIWHVVTVVLLALLLAMVPRQARLRRRASTAEQQALALLGSSGQ